MVGVLALAALAVGAVLILQPFSPPRSDVAVVKVVRAEIESTIELAGTVAATSARRVAFGTAGTVVRVEVAEGASVEAGQELATLGDTILRGQLAAAEASLAASEARLAADRAGLTAAQRTSAHDTIAQAEQALAAARTAERDVRRQQDQALGTARQALTAAEAQRDAHLALPAEPATIAADEAAIERARAALEAATLVRTTTLHQAAASVTATTAGLRAARNAYAVQTASAPAALIAADEAAIASARAAVSVARESLEMATVKAPIAGTVTYVGYRVGDRVAPGLASGTPGLAGSLAGGTATGAGAVGPTSATGASIEISDLSGLQIIATASEIDVVALSIGAHAVVTLDALPGQEIAATICQLSLTASSSGGVVGYDVRFCLPAPDQRVRVGMTANAEVLVAQREGALIVPTSAVRRSGQQSVVRVREADGTTREVDVTVGVTSGSRVEIVAGLAEGDEVVVPTPPPAPMQP